MRTILLVLTIIVGLASPGSAQLAPGDYERSFRFDGRERSYRFRVPQGYEGSEPLALVIDLHGFSSNGVQQRGISGYERLADAETFLVAHPDGFANSWNGGSCCGQAVEQDVDDVGFLKTLAGDIAEEVPVDAGRIYATGLSNGGAMSHRLVCDAADFFAAAAPNAFPIPFFPFDGCQPSRAVPVHMGMGLTDTIVPYELGAQAGFEYWRDVNGCVGAVPDVTEPIGTARCETYLNCDDGVEVTLCSVVGDDFADIPPLQIFAGHILYANDDDVDLAQRGWDFMSRYEVVPPPVLVPEPAGAFLRLAAIACLSLLAVAVRASRLGCRVRSSPTGSTAEPT